MFYAKIRPRRNSISPGNAIPKKIRWFDFCINFYLPHWKQVVSGISGYDEETLKILVPLLRTPGFNPIIKSRLSAGGKPEKR